MCLCVREGVCERECLCERERLRMCLCKQVKKRESVFVCESVCV